MKRFFPHRRQPTRRMRKIIGINKFTAGYLLFFLYVGVWSPYLTYPPPPQLPPTLFRIIHFPSAASRIFIIFNQIYLQVFLSRFCGVHWIFFLLMKIDFKQRNGKIEFLSQSHQRGNAPTFWMQGIRFFEKIVSSFFLWVRRDKVCVRVLVKRTCALEKKNFLHLITIPFFFLVF